MSTTDLPIESLAVSSSSSSSSSPPSSLFPNDQLQVTRAVSKGPFEVGTLSHQWIVEDFSFVWEQPHSSGWFPNDPNAQLIFELELTCDTSGKFLVRLYSRCNTDRKLKIRFWVSILDGHGVAKHTISNRGAQKMTTMNGKPHRLTNYKAIDSELLTNRATLFHPESTLLDNDRLTLLIQVKYAEHEDFIVSSEMCEPDTPIPRWILGSKLSALLNSADFADVTISVGGVEFKAHRVILALSSPVFAAMFHHEMSEKKDKRVEVKDMDANVFRLLLHALYTGELDEKLASQVDCTELLAAADKYQLDRLKSLVEARLISQLSTSTVVRTWIVADLCQALSLKRRAIDYIRRHSPDVFRTSTWQDEAGQHPRLLAETFPAIQQWIPTGATTTTTTSSSS